MGRLADDRDTMTPLAELRCVLFNLARRVERLQPGNARRFIEEQGEIAFALRQLARGITGGPRKDSVRGWRSPERGARDAAGTFWISFGRELGL
jgi:hypothetical protein